MTRRWPTLYARASAFAFLSEYEGFGFTPLEALAAGVPPVVLDTPVAREIYGDAAVRIPSPEPAAIAAALADVLTTRQRNPPCRAGRRPGVLARYSWPAAARDTLTAIEEAARP